MSNQKTGEVWDSKLNRWVKIETTKRPARDRVVIEAEKVYRASGQAKLDKLMRKRSLYRRRLTLALAGLEQTGNEIEEFLLSLGRDRLPNELPVEERKVR